MNAATVGLFIDTESDAGQLTLADVTRHFKNRDLQNGMAVARQTKMRFIVAAGRLDIINDGAFIILVQEEANALIGFVAANHRMAEAGWTKTQWIVAGEADFSRKAQAVLEAK